MRLVTQLSKEEFVKNIEQVREFAPVTDYFIHDVYMISGWADLPLVKGTQVWTPINSFGMIAPRKPVTWEQLTKEFNSTADFTHTVRVTCLLGAGDVLMSTAWVRAARQWWPDAKVTFRTYENFRSLVELNSDIDVLEILDTPISQQLDFAVMRTGSDFDHEVFLHHPAAAKDLLNYFTYEGGYNHFDWKGFVTGIRLNRPECRLDLSTADMQKATQIVEDEGLDYTRVVGLHALCSNGLTRSHIKLIELPDLFTDQNVTFIWFGGGRPEEVKIPSEPNFLNLANQLSWRESAALVSRCELMVCVDSAVMHLAALSQRPTLGLFKGMPSTWRGIHNPEMEYLDADEYGDIETEEIEAWIKEKLSGSMNYSHLPKSSCRSVIKY